MAIKFKKISQGEYACFYALAEEISSGEYKQLIDWLDIHCNDEYELSNMHLILARRNELFFDLTFPCD